MSYLFLDIFASKSSETCFTFAALRFPILSSSYLRFALKAILKLDILASKSSDSCFSFTALRFAMVSSSYLSFASKAVWKLCTLMIFYSKARIEVLGLAMLVSSTVDLFSSCWSSGRGVCCALYAEYKLRNFNRLY
jgi:hypothetical protein